QSHFKCRLQWAHLEYERQINAKSLKFTRAIVVD
ncbi:MAG: hypothetical protein ACI9IT_002245, partial [Glaciecola sp.]